VDLELFQATDVADVTLNNIVPNVNAGADAELTCAITSIQLLGSSSTPAATFSWSGPGIVSGGNTATPTVNSSGTYILTVTDPSNGCTAANSTFVNLNNTNPDVNAGADVVLDCAVTSIQLNGSSSTPGATFSWTGPGIVSGATSATPTINVAGTYTLVVTDPSNGCTSSEDAVASLDVLAPNVDAGSDMVLDCGNNSVMTWNSIRINNNFTYC